MEKKMEIEMETKMSNNNVISLFNSLLEKKEKVLICYVVGGYPTLEISKEIIEKLIKSGADIIEIGIPFSDPMADGQVIQNASIQALKNGTTPMDCFNLAKEIKTTYQSTPILMMTYSNIIFSKNINKFLSLAKKYDIDGFIIPDLNIDESEEYLNKMKKLGLATVFLTAPNTSKERLEKIALGSSGFIYLVSVFGITGSRSKFEKYTFDAITKSKKIIQNHKIPLAVGFGITNPNDGKKILDAGADGIIVGSSLIRIISEFKDDREKMLDAIGNLASDLKKICR